MICHNTCICLNVYDFHLGEGLTVPLLLAEAGLGTVFEDYFLFIPPLAQNPGFNFCPGEVWDSDFYFAAVCDQKNFIKNKIALGTQLLNLQFLPRGNLILLTAGFDDCKPPHVYLSLSDSMPNTWHLTLIYAYDSRKADENQGGKGQGCGSEELAQEPAPVF